MSAEPVGPPMPPGLVRRVPRTIKGIGDALTRDDRTRFLEQIMAAAEEGDFERAMDGWWAEAHLEQVSGRAERRARAAEADRSGLVSLEELSRRARTE